MAKIVLDNVLTVDPQNIKELRHVMTEIDPVKKEIRVTVDIIALSGRPMGQRTFHADGPAVETYIANQEGTILGRILTKLGVTGTIS